MGARRKGPKCTPCATRPLAVQGDVLPARPPHDGSGDTSLGQSSPLHVVVAKQNETWRDE